jgi:hypothetical protein
VVSVGGSGRHVAGQLNTRHARHLHIHQDDLGVLGINLRQSLGGVSGLTDDAMRKFRGKICQNLSQA